MKLIGKDIVCRRGGRGVLSGLSFGATPGRPLILRGPNGAGKSTLLRLLAGLLPLTSGEVTFGTASLGQDRSAFQEQVAYAGHMDAVKPALTVRQNLGVWAALFGCSDARANRALEHFGLDRIADRPAVQCSAGQKRRLGLARLMVVERPIWLLDEPTVSLDADAAEKLAGLVRAHCAEGGLALIATHIDLGLDDAEVLTLNSETAAAAASPSGTEDDAFLSGDWT